MYIYLRTWLIWLIYQLFIHFCLMKACAKWTDFGITSYCMSDIQLSWTEAAESCRLPPNNGHLVYIETEEENKEIVSFYDAVDRNGVNWCWIGIEDSLIEGIVTFIYQRRQKERICPRDRGRCVQPTGF